jgi:hypothetical protein
MITLVDTRVIVSRYVFLYSIARLICGFAWLVSFPLLYEGRNSKSAARPDELLQTLAPKLTDPMSSSRRVSTEFKPRLSTFPFFSTGETADLFKLPL